MLRSALAVILLVVACGGESTPTSTVPDDADNATESWCEANPKSVQWAGYPDDRLFGLLVFEEGAGPPPELPWSQKVSELFGDDDPMSASDLWRTDNPESWTLACADAFVAEGHLSDGTRLWCSGNAGDVGDAAYRMGLLSSLPEETHSYHEESAEKNREAQRFGTDPETTLFFVTFAHDLRTYDGAAWARACEAAFETQ